MSGRSSAGISFPVGSTSSTAPCPPSSCPSRSKSERWRRPLRPAPIHEVNMACNTLQYIFAEMLETPQVEWMESVDFQRITFFPPAPVPGHHFADHQHVVPG